MESAQDIPNRSAPGDDDPGRAARGSRLGGVGRRAWRVAVPLQMRAATDLERVDYADAFRVAPTPGTHPAERWLRGLFDDAPGPVIGAVRGIWRLLGAQLAPDPSPGHLFGCPLQVEDAHEARMVVTWTIGLRARIVARTDADETIVATIVQLDTPAARRAWRACAAIHRTLMASGLTIVAWRFARAEDR